MNHYFTFATTFLKTDENALARQCLQLGLW
jgi:hypothetical protein